MWLDEGMEATTAPTTINTTIAQLNEGDVVLSVGNTTFDAPATITQVKRYNGKAVAIFTANGGFWPVPAVGANKPCVIVK